MTLQEEYLQEQFPEVMDATQRSCFVTCPRQMYYEHILGLTPPTRTNIHFAAGGAIAKACEVARKSYYGDGKSEEDALALGMEALVQKYGPDENADHVKSLSRTIDAYLAYFGAIPNSPGANNMGVYKLGEDPFPPYKTELGVAVEFSFTMELDARDPEGNPVSYYGRFDQLVDSSFGILGCDEKTGTSLDKHWSEKWLLRGQYLGYILGARKSGIDLKGMLTRGIIFQKTQFHFPESVSLPPDQVVANYETQLNYDVEYMVGCWNNRFWPQAFGDACTAYGGCPYMRLCTSPEPEAWYPTYSITRWDPRQAKRVVVWEADQDEGSVANPFGEF